MGRDRRERIKQDRSSTRRRVIFWSVAALVLAGLVWLIAATATTPSSQSGTSSLEAPAITATDWSEGSPTSSVSMIEYGDFECPACGQYYPIVKQVVADYGNRVRFVFRNFPLPQHPSAVPAAYGAEAAGLQGKYWEMFDLLYDNQTTWSANAAGAPAIIRSYAESLGLDMAKYDSDIASSAVKNKVQNDIAGGNNILIDHTPTFFINLKQVSNPTSYDDFKSILDAAIAAAS